MAQWGIRSTTLDCQHDVLKYEKVSASTKPLCSQKRVSISGSNALPAHYQTIRVAFVVNFLVHDKVNWPWTGSHQKQDINKADMVYLRELAEQKKFKPLIDRSYPLSEIVEAYKYVETGQKKGNVIITIAC